MEHPQVSSIVEIVQTCLAKCMVRSNPLKNQRLVFGRVQASQIPNKNVNNFERSILSGLMHL